MDECVTIMSGPKGQFDVSGGSVDPWDVFT